MVPAGVDASLVIRHAEREGIAAGTFGHDVNLTAKGSRAAGKLGAALSKKRALTVFSSPVPRCVHTARAMLRGAGSSAEVVTDLRLGGPGAFVVDTEVAGPLFLELPVPEIARRQLQDETPPPGMRPTSEGVEILLKLVTSPLGENDRLHVFVTHDIILAVLVASIFHLSLEETGWPGYLEGLLLWRCDERLKLSWRELRAASLQPAVKPACPEFATSMVSSEFSRFSILFRHARWAETTLAKATKRGEQLGSTLMKIRDVQEALQPPA